MKKLLSLFFTLSLCFVLVACGETTPPAESTAKGNEQTEATTSVSDANKDEETVKAILLTDAWKTTENETAASYQSIIFHEDGTCIANGETRTWKIYHTNIGGSSLIIAKISIKNGVDTVFDFSLFDKEEYYLYTSGISFYLPDGFKAEKYKDLCQYLDNYRSSGSFYDGDTRTHYRDDAALAYLREGFAALGDYKNSTTLLASLAGIESNAEKESKYKTLCQYLDSYKNTDDDIVLMGGPPSYGFYVSELHNCLYGDEAIAYLREGFASLGDYKDSATLLESLTDLSLETQYVTLCHYLNAVKTLSENASIYVVELNTFYNNIEALAYLREGFASLGDYKDSATLLASLAGIESNAEKENRYNTLCKYLNAYKNDDSGSRGFYISELGTSLYDNEALAYLYEGFAALGDYMDCAEILSRFTVLPDMHVGVTRTNDGVDSLGNYLHITYTDAYDYNSAGNLISATISDKMRECWGSYSGQRFLFEYNGNYQITQVLVCRWDSDRVAIITPAYDEKGNMVSANVKTETTEYTNTYIYDEYGHCISSKIYNGYHFDTKIYTYTYDTNGVLIQKTCSFEELAGDVIQTISYHYENDVLVSSTEKWERLKGKNYNETWNVKNEYTCDENGRILSVDIFDESETVYSSQKWIYNYETLYFYNESN